MFQLNDIKLFMKRKIIVRFSFEYNQSYKTEFLLKIFY